MLLAIYLHLASRRNALEKTYQFLKLNISSFIPTLFFSSKKPKHIKMGLKTQVVPNQIIQDIVHNQMTNLHKNETPLLNTVPLHHTEGQGELNL